MGYDKKLAERISHALAHVQHVTPKKMFSGIAFMVNSKMCINVTSDGIMCRVDPKIHDSLLEKPGCRPVVMKGRELKGWVLVAEDVLKSKKDLDFWVSHALSFNSEAKFSKKQPKK